MLLFVRNPNENLGLNKQLANQLHKLIRCRVMLSKYRKGERNNMTWQGVRDEQMV